jgi:hypothetical protein
MKWVVVMHYMVERQRASRHGDQCAETSSDDGGRGQADKMGMACLTLDAAAMAGQPQHLVCTPM